MLQACPSSSTTICERLTNRDAAGPKWSSMPYHGASKSRSEESRCVSKGPCGSAES